MKKFLLIIFALFFMNNVCFAEYEDKTPIDFIYIHGSDQGTAEEFEVWMNRMHPNMKKNLEANAFVREHLLADAYIKPEKDMLYWADKTQTAKQYVEVGLKISKLISTCFAQLTRSTLAHLLHDAIWLQKNVNMDPILDELNEKVIANAKKGEKTVLVGYSAGTFITYQYMMNKIKSFNPVEFFTKFQTSLNVDAQDIAELKKQNVQTTCIDALTDSDVAILKANGELIANPNKEKLRANFKKLKTQTQLSCAPDNAISGILNFGSPIIVFYSSDDDMNSQIAFFGVNLYRYVVENKSFTLTVNYKTDPLGVPMENFTISQLKEYTTPKAYGGFNYDTSVSGGVMFISSHLKYWDQTNHFTKAVARSYEQGYRYFYELPKTK